MPTDASSTVLVVDDEAFIRDLATAALEARGLKVSRVGSGAEALARLAEPAPDLVLLDIGLPDVPGLEVLKHLRGARGWDGVRILMLTGEHDTDVILRAKDAGASGYLCKPISAETLAAMVTDMLADDSLIWLDDYTRARRT